MGALGFNASTSKTASITLYEHQFLQQHWLIFPMLQQQQQLARPCKRLFFQLEWVHHQYQILKGLAVYSGLRYIFCSNDPITPGIFSHDIHRFYRAWW